MSGFEGMLYWMKIKENDATVVDYVLQNCSLFTALDLVLKSSLEKGGMYSGGVLLRTRRSTASEIRHLDNHNRCRE